MRQEFINLSSESFPCNAATHDIVDVMRNLPVCMFGLENFLFDWELGIRYLFRYLAFVSRRLNLLGVGDKLVDSSQKLA